MFGRPVLRGAIYHVGSRRRREIAVTPELHERVLGAAGAIRALLIHGRLAPPVNDGRCRQCSLNELCEPAALAATSLQAELAVELFRGIDLV